MMSECSEVVPEIPQDHPNRPPGCGESGPVAGPQCGGHSQAGRRFRRWCAFHAENGDLAQGVVIQTFEQPAILVGHHGGELGSRLRAHGSGEQVVLVVVAATAGKLGGGTDLSAPALLPELAADLGLDLAGRDDDQKPPEVVAVGKLGESAPGQPRKRLSKALKAASSSSLPASLCRDDRRRSRASSTTREK